MRLFARAAPQADWLVVGLGNPGEEYAATRHNLGFLAAGRFAKRARLEFKTKAADARIAEGQLGAVRLAIAKPQTFMNESGRSVRRLLQRYRLEPGRLVVIYDDADLPLGRIRIRPSGGPGTHNGMRDVIGQLRTEAFPRVRCGIAPRDPPAGLDMTAHVLSPFADSEREAAEQMVARAAEAVEVLLRDGVSRAMERFNG